MTGEIPVFIFEDSPHVLSALHELVPQVGPFRVVATAAGEMEATAWLLEHKADWRVAILDLLAREGSGFGLIGRFRRAQPNGRVIVFSEYATPGVKQRCLELGADAAFLKSELQAFTRFLEETALPA